MEYAELASLVAWNRFATMSFMFERSALDAVGMFDESLPVCGDWEFNIRFLSKFEITVLKETLAFYHQRRKAKGSYGNSLFARSDEHRKYRARLSNRWIREGLSNGTLGLGKLFILSNLIDSNEQYRQLIERRERRRIFSRIRSLIPQGSLLGLGDRVPHRVGDVRELWRGIRWGRNCGQYDRPPWPLVFFGAGPRSSGMASDESDLAPRGNLTNERQRFLRGAA